MQGVDLTLTGADDSVDPEELARLAAATPEVEWALLIDTARAGSVRFPSDAWRREFIRAAPQARRAAHVCGEEQLRELSDFSQVRDGVMGQELRGSSGDLPNYRRIQLNFDARTLPLLVLAGLVGGWRNYHWRRIDGTTPALITQHNTANRHVHLLFRDANDSVRHYPPYYAVLFDESGGRGHVPQDWPVPLPELPCGYAGGISSSNIAATVERVRAHLGDRRRVWLDMESCLRTGDVFDPGKVAEVIDAWRKANAGLAVS
jgi:hypothetical protein